MINFYFILFFSLLTRLSIADDIDDVAEKKFISCGLYGFRCLDKKRAQICDEKYRDEDGLPRPRTFECAKGLVCDEEKTEFCSPAEKSYANCSTTERSFRKRKSKRFKESRLQRRISVDFFDDDDRSATVISTTTVDDDEDGDEEQTEKSEIDPWNGNPPITCTSHGFFPGMKTKNSSNMTEV